MNEGGQLRLFNGQNGEWLADIKKISKQSILVEFTKELRQQKSSPEIHILASPIKKEALDFMVEKVTELCASHFWPVTCERTIVRRINQERLQAVATEAAEQSERLDVMRVEELSDLEPLLARWPSQKRILCCLERSEAPMLAQTLKQEKLSSPLGILVGPEGGFSEKEIKHIKRLDFITSVSLGEGILKSETAAVAALAVIRQFI